ncbi:MAG: hypothetical protein M3467_02355 [Actinomycetota bacterium]|nr:hypothetical protein [Actinomycetota bacterium]
MSQRAVLTARDSDTNIISYCNGANADAEAEIGVKRMSASSNIGPVPFSKSSAYRSPQVDKLFEQVRTTVDPAVRTGIYRELHEQLLEDLPFLWNVKTESSRIFTQRCSGFSPAGHFAETASVRSSAGPG